MGVSVFGIAGVQMHVTAYQDNVDHIHGYLRHIRARFPWVRMVMFSELAPLVPGVKIGDIDPRCESATCHEISDKALAVGGGVVEAVLTWSNQ